MAWSKKENEFFKQNYDKMSKEELAESLGKSIKSIETKLGFFKKYTLQNKKYVVKPNSANTTCWNEDNINFLKENYPAMDYRDIAKTLGIHSTTVREKLQSLGLKSRRIVKKKQPSNWNEEEIIFLKDNYLNMTRVELAEKLKKTENHIRMKLHELGLKKTQKRGHHKSWSSNEDEIIKSICLNKDIHKEKKLQEMKSLLPNRSELAIYKRISKLGLRKHITKLETIPEKLVKEILEYHNIDFSSQVRVQGTRYIIDFVVKNIAIEVQGDYWHCNPKVYINGPKDKIQKRKIQDDINKKSKLKELGYEVVYIWELDIMNNLDQVKNKLIEIINKANGGT